ncbi:hypothetical protein Agub_g9402, partial [Astrephomene gubernaculifera]
MLVPGTRARARGLGALLLVLGLAIVAPTVGHVVNVAVYSSDAQGDHDLYRNKAPPGLISQLLGAGFRVDESARQPVDSDAAAFVVPTRYGSALYHTDVSATASFVSFGGVVILIGTTNATAECDFVARILGYKGAWLECGSSKVEASSGSPVALSPFA